MAARPLQLPGAEAMTRPEALPYGATHFDVRISGQAEPVLGFCAVLFDPFVNSALAPGAEAAAPAGPDPGLDTPPVASGAQPAPPSLVLRRGFDGSLALYKWWDQCRKRRLQRGRTVTVHLLDPGRHTPLVSWIFKHAQPVLLAYSPLNALHGGVLMETLTLHYDSVTMKSPSRKQDGKRAVD